MRYLLIVERIKISPHWKKDRIPTASDGERKLGGYTAMVKLTVYIHNRS